MAKIRLLEAVCTIAMLAATPALAQRPEAGMTNANGKPNPEATQSNPNTTGMAPANNGANTTSMVNPNDGSTDTSTASHATHRMAMAHPASTMGRPNDTSQDAAVNRLNDESYQAAQKGRTFTVSGNQSSAGAPPMPGSSAGGSSAKP